METPDSAPQKPALVLRGLVLTSMLLLGAAFVAHSQYTGLERSRFTGLAMWVLALAQLPYALALWWLLALEEPKGRALALGWCSLTLGMSAAILPGVWSRYEERDFGLLALATTVAFLTIQAGTAALALKGSSGQRVRWSLGFLKALGFLLLLAVSAALGMPPLEHAGVAEARRHALLSLRRISQCAEQYARAHPAEGFPAGFAALGPAASGCIGPKLVAGLKDGYRFAYRADLVDGDGRRSGFSVFARAVSDIQRMNLLLRQTLTERSVHYVNEDKEPAFSDPTLDLK